MASYKVNWILVLWALVGCVQASTAASTGGTDANLMSQLVDKQPEQMKEILQNHGNQDFKLGRYKVAKWVELCTPSLSSCTHETFLLLSVVTISTSEESVQLEKYASYCNSEMKNFCLENFDNVKKSFVQSLKEEEKELALSYIEILDKKWPDKEQPEDKHIVNAWNKLRESKPNVATARQTLLDDFKKIFFELNEFYYLSRKYLKNLPSEFEPRYVTKWSRGFPWPTIKFRTREVVSKQSKSKEDILIINWWKLCAAGYRILLLRDSFKP